MRLLSILPSVALSFVLATTINAAGHDHDLIITNIGSYGGGAEVFDESAAEIVVFDKTSSLLLVTNAFTNSLDVLDITDPTNPSIVNSINNTGLGINSVAVYEGLAAVALEAEVKQDTGSVAFYDLTVDNGNYLGSVEVSTNL